MAYRPRTIGVNSKFSQSGGDYVTYDFVRNLKATYPSEYPFPRYAEFIRRALSHGFKVKLYTPSQSVSKYVMVYDREKRFKVRFSNHKPIEELEAQKSCDFFVGVTNFMTTTMEDAWEAMMGYFGRKQ